MTKIRDPKTRMWRAVRTTGAIVAVVCAVVAILVGTSTGQVFAVPGDGVESLDDAQDLLTDQSPGQTLYFYAPEGTDIVYGRDAVDAAGGEYGGSIDEYEPPHGWPGGCEFAGPELYVNYLPRFDAPVEFEGVPHVPILSVMNGSTPDASYTVECEADDLVVATPTSNTRFSVHGVFWPAVAVGGLGLAAALVGAVALAVRRRASPVMR